jgi:hypothetical protein
MPPFEAHGGAVMEVRGRILVFRPQGPGNFEEIERLLPQISEVAPTLRGSVWAALIAVSENHLLTPDAEARLQGEAMRLARSGQVATAIVAQDGATGPILESQFRRIYEGTGNQIARFEREVDAVDWLNRILWKGSSP